MSYRKMGPKLAGLCRHERGQALVELAVITPILLLLIAGIIEAGRAFYTYVQLANASREGGRYGMLSPTDASGITSSVGRELPSWITGATTAATCAAAGTNTFATCNTSTNARSGDQLKVTVNYNYTPIMPFLNGIGSFTAVTMSTSAIMPIP